MPTDFVKRLDDVIRQELSLLGHPYDEIVASIDDNQGGEGAIVRFHPPYEDVWFDEPDEDVTAEQFTAKVHRRLVSTLEGPMRPAAPDQI